VSAPATVFGREFNEALVHQLVTAYQANARQGTRAQKDRAMVKHSTKKPWRQKGTGRGPRRHDLQSNLARRWPDLSELARRELHAEGQQEDVPGRGVLDPVEAAADGRIA